MIVPLEFPQTEQGRRALLGAAQFLGVDLVAIGTESPNGSVSLDWATLASAVSQAYDRTNPKEQE